MGLLEDLKEGATNVIGGGTNVVKNVGGAVLNPVSRTLGEIAPPAVKDFTTAVDQFGRGVLGEDTSSANANQFMNRYIREPAIAAENKKKSEEQQRKDMQDSLVKQAQQFSSDIPKNQQMLVGAADAATYGQAKQQERMQRSQAAAGGQVGSGIAKLRLANLSAGAKYAHVKAEAAISQKLKDQAAQMGSQAITSGQALAGMSLENAQNQYNLELDKLKAQNASLGSVGGALGYGVGSYLANSSSTNTPTLSNGYSQNYTMPGGYLTGAAPSRGYLGAKDLGLGGLTNG